MRRECCDLLPRQNGGQTAPPISGGLFFNTLRPSEPVRNDHILSIKEGNLLSGEYSWWKERSVGGRYT